MNPVRELAARAHAVGALVLVDGAQAAPHLRIDVTELSCDFFACSGHKLYGPTGVGVLYGRGASCSSEMPPWQGGGDMIERVTLEGSTWARAAGPVRGGHAADRGGPGTGYRPRLPRSGRVGSHRCLGRRAAPPGHRADQRDPGGAPGGHGAGKGRGALLHARGRSPSRCRHRPGRRRRGGAGGPSLCATGDGRGSGSRRPCGPRSPSTTRRKRSTRWPAVSSARVRCSADGEPGRAVPERHSGAQPVSPELPRDGKRRSPSGGQQPALR